MITRDTGDFQRKADEIRQLAKLVSFQPHRDQLREDADHWEALARGPAVANGSAASTTKTIDAVQAAVRR